MIFGSLEPPEGRSPDGTAKARSEKGQAKLLKTSCYDAGKFSESLISVKALMARHPENFFGELQRICAEAGPS